MNYSPTKHKAEPTGLRTRIRRGRPGVDGAAETRAATPASGTGAVRRGWRSVRPFLILSVVAGMIATVSLPAFASSPSGASITTQSIDRGVAQRLSVDASAAIQNQQRDDYTATSQADLDKAKADAAAAAAAAQRAKEVAARGASALRNIDLNMVAPGSGAVRWPLPYYDGLGDVFMSNGGTHDGVDFLVGAGTPIFTVASGTVKVSSENYYGYGVAVVIEHNIGGQRVETTYGHMTYGTRAVQVGDTVSAGQLIGQVGSTGRSTANHLHFEVRVNGSLVDPMAWLRANAG